jgi:hypothetical protein
MGRWINRDPLDENGGDNLCSFLSNEPTVNCDKLGLVKWNTEETTYTYDLGNLGDSTATGENYTGGPTWTAKPGYLAVSVASWETSVKCKCKTQNVWILEQIKIVFKPKVRFRNRKSYTSDAQFEWARIKEQDHIADYKWWARNVGKPLADTFEANHTDNTFASDSECSTQIKSQLERDIAISFSAAVAKSITDWDQGNPAKHTYPCAK